MLVECHGDGLSHGGHNKTYSPLVYMHPSPCFHDHAVYILRDNAFFLPEKFLETIDERLYSV